MIQKTIFAAPIQGITDCAWRKAHAQVFGGVDCYFAPFMRVEHGGIRPRDLRDLLPADNAGTKVIPQVLACRPDAMRQMIAAIADLGYQEIDINLGCPHPPLVRKGFGVGMLQRTEHLEQMFDLLSSVTGMRFSLKLRLGWDDSEQWKAVIPHLANAPVENLIIHYRLGIQQYKGEARLDLIADTLQATQLPIVVNGDINSPERLTQLSDAHPQVAGFMIGRALVADPALLTPPKATPQHYNTFHDLLYEHYRQHYTGGDHQVLAKMQSFWEQFLPNADRRARKAIRKASSLHKYEVAVGQLFQNHPEPIG